MKVDDPRAATPERRATSLRPDLEDRIFTARIGAEWFGIPVACVHTVFNIEAMTPIPLAPTVIVGLVNLRGRIVTAVSLRRRLGLPDAADGMRMAIGIEHRGDALALVVDEAGDVLSLAASERIDLPRHMPLARARFAHSVARFETGIICVLNMSAVFDLSPVLVAA